MRYKDLTTQRRFGFHSMKIETDRGALLATLALPGILAAVAFIIAVSLALFGVPRNGTWRSTIAALSYLYLTLSVMWLPAYCIAYAWYWRVSRDETVLLKRLWIMPLVTGLFVWFPGVLFAQVPVGEKVRILLPFVLTAVVSGYAWTGIVRLAFYVWRRK
jgi:hypothetical protein